MVWTVACLVLWWAALQMSIVFWKPDRARPFWKAVVGYPALEPVLTLLKWLMPIMFLSLSLGFVNAFLFLSLWYAGNGAP